MERGAKQLLLLRFSELYKLKALFELQEWPFEVVIDSFAGATVTGKATAITISVP